MNPESTVSDRPHFSREATAKPRRRFDRVDAFLVAVLLAAFLAVGAIPIKPKAYGDGDFFEGARALALNLRHSHDPPPVIINKAVGPVLYYTVPFLFIPPSAPDRQYWRVAVGWNFAAMLIALLLVRRAAARLAGRQSAGVTASLLLIASPLPVYYSFGILAEPPAFFAAALLAWLGTRIATHADVRGLPLVVGSCGLALLLLARPNAALLIPLGLAATFVLSRSRHALDRRGARHTAIVTLAATIAMFATPIMLGAGSGSQGDYLGYVVFHGRFQFRTEPWDWRFWDDSVRSDSVDYQDWVATSEMLLRQLESSGPSGGLPRARTLPQLQWQWVREDLIHHPWLSLRQAAVRGLALHVALVNSVSPERLRVGPVPGAVILTMIHLIINAGTLLIALGGLVFLARRCREPQTLARTVSLWGPWAALLVFHMLTYAEPRYMLPSRPGLAILAATALAQLPRLAAGARRSTSRS